MKPPGREHLFAGWKRKEDSPKGKRRSSKCRKESAEKEEVEEEYVKQGKKSGTDIKAYRLKNEK